MKAPHNPTLYVENLDESAIVADEMTDQSSEPDAMVMAVDEPSGSAAQSPFEPQLLGGLGAHLYPNYAQPGFVMDHGSGARLYDLSGKRYIDLFAGIAVSSLGHNHPALVRAISQQAGKLIHLSNYFYNEPNARLTPLLCELCGMDRAFFCNSGTEANEAALKLARRYFYDQGQPDRHVIIAFENSFHGRTMGALAVTGQAKYRTGFGPLPEVRHVPYGDLQATRAAMDERVAAIIVEPVQGEGGVIVPPRGFFAGLRELCDESGALLIVDEIQTGTGRTGKFLGCQHEDVVPDIVSLAKGLGGGVPIGAMLCKERLARTLVPGSHGTTFGGNPLASAAALAVVMELTEHGLMDQIQATTAFLERGLDALVSKHSCITERRGRGLLQALVLRDGSQGPAILADLRDAGVLLTFAGGTALRITPPLVITENELELGLGLIDNVLGKYS
ncbi:MAG TPA: aspartate aminotransferase family protein [Polyangiaceae bacterium]|nr:aspartate aminotransferase family protein [Polyangiaceae bacterium]